MVLYNPIYQTTTRVQPLRSTIPCQLWTPEKQQAWIAYQPICSRLQLVYSTIFDCFDKLIPPIGTVYTEWKKSLIVPIPKSSSVTTPNDYQPIFLLSILNKVLKQHVHILFQTISITCTLSQTLNGVLTREVHSDCTLATVDNWLRMVDEGSEIRAVFFDVQKAIDSVPLKVLMEKLQVTSWSNYQHSGLITFRKQIMIVNG